MNLHKQGRAWVASSVVFGLLSLAGAASAQTYTLDFDTDFSNAPISDGTLVSTAYNIPGVTFTANDYIYASGAGGTVSAPNFASGLSSLAPFEIDFSTPQTYVSADNITNSEYTLQAFDAGNNLLGNVVTFTDFEQTSLSAPGKISKVVFTATNTAGFGFGYGFDNLVFSTTPEPGTLALLAGMTVPAASFALRRKRRNTKA